jgi:hypothetical protein|tara:strand:+ start:331 stop:516 length:186 start_codon:yes stop_codon:yes gene_type:complete
MVKNLWDQERRILFKNVLKEYETEGYTREEAGKLARKEVNELMVDKEDFVNKIWDQSYEEE